MLRLVKELSMKLEFIPIVAILAVTLLLQFQISSIEKQKVNDCLKRGDGFNYKGEFDGCVFDVKKAPKPLDIKVPNELLMTDGCIVRAGYRRYLTYPYTNKPGWIFVVGKPLNAWSKKCINGKDSYYENEVVRAKYK